MTRLILLLSLIPLAFTGCSKGKDEPLRVGINPWPGYQLLQLANALGYYDEFGVQVEIVDLMSSGEVARVYERGYIDIGTSTTTDLVSVRINSSKKPKTFYICDFSNGADVIVAPDSYPDLKALKGKRIAADTSALDYIHLLSALEYYDMSIEDITVVPMRQTAMKDAALEGSIDAAVTYPPVSVELYQADSDLHPVFDSSMIPGVIVDLLVAEEQTLIERKQDIIAFIKAVEKARDYFEKNPSEAIEIMSTHCGISPEEFEDALAGLRMTPPGEQYELLSDKESLVQTIYKVYEMFELSDDFEDPRGMFTTTILEGVIN